MCKPNSGRFKGTKGDKNTVVANEKAKKKISPLFRNGKITYAGVSAHREKFMGKNVYQIAKILKKQGYEVSIKDSKRKKKGSKAKIIVITNSSQKEHRNITQVQVSPGSRRHGNIPYVKISTFDKGVIKIINVLAKNIKLMERKKRGYFLGGNGIKNDRFDNTNYSLQRHRNF